MNKVASKDGTEIAYWSSGDGPPLLLVHGTTADHTRWAPMLQYLEPHATVYTMDRRGRGESGDAPEYHAKREFEDVAVLIDTIAQTTGSTVDVYGHSYGAMCALGAALLTSNIRRLVLYEPVVDGQAGPLSSGFVAEMEALLAEGNREAVVLALFGEALDMSEEDKEAFRAMPTWPMRIAAAHTVPRETQAENDRVFDIARAPDITVPTLMLSGANSPDFIKADTASVASALPDVRVVVLEGQDHIADLLDPEVFWPHVLDFLKEGR